MLRLLGLNRINFLVKKSFIFLALLGSVFVIFNSPKAVYAEDPAASLTVTGDFNIDLTPQGTEQIMLRASGMQAIAKTSSMLVTLSTFLVVMKMVILPTKKHQILFLNL